MKYKVDVNLNEKTSHTLILEKIKKNSKVLEFGSATGYMTKFMKEQLHCQVTCIEIDKEAAKQASVYAEKMIVADVEKMEWEQELKGQEFDYIIYADVLEHLRNSEEVLKNSVSYLKESGSVIISVPNIGHNAIIMDLINGEFNYNDVGLLDNTHVRFFTRKSVFELLEYAGLSGQEWLTTMRNPSTTEFKNHYEDQPVVLQEILQQRVDGEVYQFITVSQKKNLEKNNGLVGTEKFLNYLDKDYLQVFWDDNSGFEEEKSIKKNIELDGLFHTYTLETSIANNGRIRIDPTNTLAYFEIKNLGFSVVEGDQNEYYVDVVKENKVQKEVELHNILSLGSITELHLLSISNDPAIVIRNIFKSQVKIKKIYIEMKVTERKKDLIAILESYLKKFEQTIGVMNSELEKTKYQKQKSEEKLTQAILQKDLEIDQLQKENIRIKEKLNEYISVCENFKSDKETLVEEKKHLENLLKNEKENIVQLLSSHSWKVTKPLRTIKNMFDKE